MALKRFSQLCQSKTSVFGIPWKSVSSGKWCVRTATTTPSGAILPEPKRTRFGFLGVVSSVALGLLIGATISKNMANFLEENDLFVPSDDDDDDDD